MNRIVAAALLVAACDARDPLTDCGGDLRGVWRAPGESPSGEPRRYQLIAGPWSWELYPMFDDGVVDEPLEDGVIAAGAVVDVFRFPGPAADKLIGLWSRRFERRNHRCRVVSLVLIEQCRGDAFTLAGVPPQPPAELETCAPRPPGARVEWRFTRE